MEKYFNDILHKPQNSINELEIETDFPIKRIEAVIQLIVT